MPPVHYSHGRRSAPLISRLRVALVCEAFPLPSPFPVRFPHRFSLLFCYHTETCTYLPYSYGHRCIPGALYPPAVVFTLPSLRLSSIVIHLFFELRIRTFAAILSRANFLPLPSFVSSLSPSASDSHRRSSFRSLVLCHLPSLRYRLFRPSSVSRCLSNFLRFISSRSALICVSWFLSFFPPIVIHVFVTLVSYLLCIEHFMYRRVSF